jgi:hypothetical protein
MFQMSMGHYLAWGTIWIMHAMRMEPSQTLGGIYGVWTWYDASVRILLSPSSNRWKGGVLHGGMIQLIRVSPHKMLIHSVAVLNFLFVL